VTIRGDITEEQENMKRQDDVDEQDNMEVKETTDKPESIDGQEYTKEQEDMDREYEKTQEADEIQECIDGRETAEYLSNPAVQDGIGLQQSLEDQGSTILHETAEMRKAAEKPDDAEKRKGKYKKIIIGSAISLCTLIVIYFGMSLFFMNHFYFGSKINGINVSGKSAEAARKQMVSYLQAYTLNLKEQGGKSEQITGAEIDLKHTPDEAFDSLKSKQNPFGWVLAIFNPGDFRMTTELTYDEKLLKERVEKLSCFDSANIVEPQNPSFKYTDSSYAIVDEVNGNKVNKDTLYGIVASAILKMDTQIDLESTGCYIKPQYTSKSQKVSEVRDLLNKYVSSKITYTFKQGTVVLDGSVISKWIKIDGNLEVSLDQEQIKSYLDNLSSNYAQKGKITDFTTTSGKTINISGGDYDWMINTTKEIENICEAIAAGKTITKEPVYVQTAYVEIDLTKQHLWFYKNGSLIVQGDIVSGNMDSTHATPAGVFSLKYKKTDAILRGPGYAAHVKFWMPFYNGMGIHDATWRRSFGGSIYKTDGSHGCINCPYNLAKTIYDNIQSGTPIICYY
jgi:Uncharacterized protein conserved in bacteria